MGLLELSSIRDDIIGMRGSGLSTEQRKRVTIAVELVANPVSEPPAHRLSGHVA